MAYTSSYLSIPEFDRGDRDFGKRLTCVFPEGGFEKQPLDDIEFYTPPSTAPRNILLHSPLDFLMELTDMFQDHESWGGSSRKPDLKVVSII